MAHLLLALLQVFCLGRFLDWIVFDVQAAANPLMSMMAGRGLSFFQFHPSHQLQNTNKNPIVRGEVIRLVLA